MSKIKCFHYHKLGYFATKCPHKKANKKPSRGVVGEALASQFKLDFSLISCMVPSIMDNVWYLDSGDSFHMTDDKDLFSNLEEKDIQMHIEMGDDGRYSRIGIGTVTFQMESSSLLTLRDVMYVLGLKNLVSVAMLEDRGYDVIFCMRKAFLHDIATRKVKGIGV